MRFRWRNVPIPEIHVTGIIIGVVLHYVYPFKIFGSIWIGHLVGWLFIVLGIVVSLWAVVTAGSTDIAAPAKLVTAGPYAFSRNPMYVGWTLIHFGVGFTVNEAWIVILSLPAVIFTHLLVIRREEKQLDEQFGELYQKYKNRVRRYL